MSTPHTSELPVRLGANHGYLIDGDVARIHADVEIRNPSLLTGDWALQLWACEAPHAGGPLSGVIVAEAALGGRVGAADSSQRLFAEAHARVPGGLRDYAMVLVLASGQDGHYRQVHDFANYPARQRFVTPHLEGSVGYQIEDGHVVIKADAVRSPRDLDNLSGSLSLELWALPAAYCGGDLDGQRLGGVDLGRLAGQAVLSDIAARVPFTPPSAGRWDVVLMLREWTESAGYVTRDYAGFEVPYLVDEPATTTVVEAPAPVADARPEVTAAAATQPSGVSINRAREVELAAVKGLSKPLAREIVKGRPYNSLEALLDVRGMGPKLLARLRPHLTL